CAFSARILSRTSRTVCPGAVASGHKTWRWILGVKTILGIIFAPFGGYSGWPVGAASASSSGPRAEHPALWGREERDQPAYYRYDFGNNLSRATWAHSSVTLK